ncbi:hypothetical protein [Bacillus weihaiensis]|nr:hypothetical protein [Bacillus weihaiensis]
MTMPGYVNEVYILITVAISMYLYKVLPRKFPFPIFVLNFVFSISIGLSADHLIATKPFELYDVNDTSNVELVDIAYYSMYGFSGYFFLYAYEHFRIRGLFIILYILLWSVFSVFYEWIAMLVGIFDYSKGYEIKYSFPVYLYSQSLYILFYLFIKKEYQATRRKYL